ncbi:hypothetical protein COL5a_011239 [Colletotrichum fioriniae]|nr:hypothetical protein COL5a_011239 [Colletotrichum fioriniae]
MSSSLARTRSLRKPTQGSSTDLPPTTTTISVSSSASITAARGPASSTAGGGGGGGGGPSASLAATRPTTRTVSGASIVNSTVTATTASEAPKKKRPNPLSSLLSRSSSTRQPASATTSTSTRQRDVAAGAGGGGGSTSSGPTSAPLSRTSALSGLTRTSSTREPGLTRTRYPANASTSNLSLVSSSTATAAGRTAAGSGPSTPTTARPTTSGGLPSSRRAGVTATTSTAAGAGSPTKGHARAKSVATLNNTTVLRPPSQTSSSGAAGPAPRSRPTSLYGAPPTSSYPSSTASTTTRSRPPSATDRLSSKPSVSSLSSTTTTTSTRTARAGSTTTAPPPPRQPLKQPQKPPPSHQAAPPHLARQQAQQRHPSPTSPPRTTKPVLRPAFSTLQQHYSPAKSLAPKPLTATYLAAPSPSKLPANIALTAETSRLQTELLQLHLLHRDLPQVTSQWHASARSKLAARHADLAASARSLVTLESDAAERRNLAALQSWGATPSTGGRPTSSSSSPLPLEDRIQRLDALLTSLWSLDSPGGKHHRLVRTFERWASSLADLEAARARAEDGADPSALLDDSADVRFGGGLDARWKEEAAALVRRLEGWDAQLRELEYGGDDDEDAAAGAGAGTDATAQASSLKRMLDGCSSLVRDMLDELAVMEDIEAAAVERENEWIKKMNREGDDGRGRDTQRAGAIWRVI